VQVEGCRNKKNNARETKRRVVGKARKRSEEVCQAGFMQKDEVNKIKRISVH